MQHLIFNATEIRRLQKKTIVPCYFSINKMYSKPLNILLADDDIDDCSFFELALSELALPTHLITIYDGEELMKYLLKNKTHLPDILFLDLSMPRKNGFECLYDIKENKHLKKLPIVIFTTAFILNKSYEDELIKRLNLMGASNFLAKRGDFSQRKLSIHQAIIKALA
jgi:CheY-like chemotaxis protein